MREYMRNGSIVVTLNAENIFRLNPKTIETKLSLSGKHRLKREEGRRSIRRAIAACSLSVVSNNTPTFFLERRRSLAATDHARWTGLLLQPEDTRVELDYS